MAQGQISREAIESLPRRKRRAQPSTTVDTYVEPRAPRDQPSNTSRVVKGLLSFSGQAMDTAVRSEKAKIDLDKVTQQQRALQGLDPTDDATKAGLRSYQVVNMRDQVLETNAELAKRVQENPDMSDEEYEVATREAYSGLVSQYQPDPQLSEALSNRLQESQIQLHQVRKAAQRDHQDWLKRDAIGSSIEEYREAASSTEDLATVIGEEGSLATEADALGVTPEEYRNTLVNAAQRDASVGDGRLLAALETMDWASRDDRISQAREVYQRKKAQKDSVEIGDQWGTIQEDFKTRNASWEQTKAAIENLNNRYPGTITQNQVASLKQQRGRIDQEERRQTNLLQDFFGNLNNADDTRFAHRPDVTDAEVKTTAAQASRAIDELAEQAVASGEIEESEKYLYTMEKKLTSGRATGAEMPELSRIFSSLSSMDPADFRNEEGIPTWADEALQVLPMLNESDIRQYGANSKVRAFINNYNAMRTTRESDPRAWRRAWTATYGETNLTPTQQAEAREAARKNAKDSTDRSIFGVIGNAIGLTQNVEVPDHIRNWIGSAAERDAQVMIGSGATDVDSVGNSSAERTMEDFTILSSGSAINRNRSRLLAEASDAQGKPLLRPDEFDKSFEWLFGENIEQIQSNSVIDDIEITDVRFISREGGLIMPTDKQGSPLLNRPITMQELGTQYREAVDAGRVEEVLSEARRRREARKAREERARNQRGPAGTAR